MKVNKFVCPCAEFNKSFLTSIPALSTSAINTGPANTPRHWNITYEVRATTSTAESPSYIPQNRSPIKMYFPRFDDAKGEDPMAFTERCKGYLAIHLLMDIQ